MEELKTYRLADICNSIQTGPFGSQLHKSDYVEFGTPIVMPKDITNGKINDNNISRISKNDVARLFKHKLVPGNIIYPRRGDISKCALITSKEDGWVCGTGCIKVDINQQIANSTYVMYVLCQSETVNWIESNAVGTTMLNLNTSILSDLPIKLPSLNTQKKLANIVSSFDKKIALNRRINDNLELQAQLLFDNLIDASDWSTTQFLSELSEINPPRKLSKGEYAPFVEMSNMPTSGSFPSRIDYKEYNGGMKFRNGDTIMARITPCLENGKAAYVNFLKENEIGFGSTEYIVLAPKKTISSSFLYFLVRNKEFVDYAVKHMNGSSGRQRVSGDTIGNYQLPILDRNKLSIFIAIADRTLSKIRQNSFEILNLAKQRDTLLPKLMSGELKINDLNC